MYKFESHVTRNDVIMMSLPETKENNVKMRTNKIYIVGKALMRAIQTANEHDSQNGEFYFRTVFHFRTNHEAAGSRRGSGASRHVPLNWFLPENHCFLEVHFLQNCHSRMKKQDGHKKLRS